MSKKTILDQSSSIKKKININNINEHLLSKPEKDWDKFESIICESINVKGAKKMKILKRGWRSVIKNPLILFDDTHHNLKLHFDMHHGFGNLDLAIDLLDEDDKNDFNSYVNTNTKFNPHIMFITKPEIANKWFDKLFPWLERCEKKLDLKIFQATTPKDCMLILRRDTYLFGLKNIQFIKNIHGYSFKIKERWLSGLKRTLGKCVYC